jgi:hypothetical protein
MEAGDIELKAWGVGIAPQAQLHFNADLILKDQYVPVVGLIKKGTSTAGHRCKSCRIVVFHYPE